MGNAYPSSGLPPADRINQYFFNNKCGDAKEEDKSKFFDWCRNLGDGHSSFNATCRGLGESADTLCVEEISFLNKTAFFWNETCDVGTKPVKGNDTIKIDEEMFQKIQDSCEAWYNGIGLTWWAYLLIVLGILIIIAMGAGLIWQYWLKKRWYRNREAAMGSTLTSRWTESPVSSTAPSAFSEVPSSAAASASKRSQSRASKPASFGGSQQKPSSIRMSGQGSRPSMAGPVPMASSQRSRSNRSGAR